jgi:prepilin-type N-terminal cleavage/methylation domain-containing protein
MLTDRRAQASSEHGFSLVELLVAMVVTLIVTGAIYGLLASGQNAFRREPLLSERQQNIRSAMDILQADIATAGSALPMQFQVFAGPPTNAGLNAATTVPAAGTDVLQMYTSDGNCPVVPAGNQVLNGGAANHVVSNQPFTSDRPLPTCYGPSGSRGIFAVTNVTNAVYIGRATLGTASPAPSVLTFDPFDATKFDACNANPPTAANCGALTIAADPAGGAFPQASIVPVKIIRYEIAVADAVGPPPDTMLCLWRSETGGLNPATGAFVSPGPGNPAVWRMVARGIINMKVSYLAASTPLPAPSPTPGNPPVMPPAAVFANMVRSVVVTLTARTEMQLQAGRPVSPWQGNLTTVTTPRAALANLSQTGAAALQWH